MKFLLYVLLIFTCGGCAAAPAVGPAATITPQLSPSPTSAGAATAQEIPTPALTPSSTAAGICAGIHGQIQTRQITDEKLPKSLDVRVYLPPCYDAQRPEPYPLLVLLHGQSYDDTQWVDLGVDETADELISSGMAAPFVIAMPREEYYLQDPAVSFFETAVSEALLPWMADEYNVCTQRECRAIGGISRGAAWAIHIGLDHWDQFSAIGAHSLPPFASDQYTAPRKAGEIPPGMAPRIWIDIGNTDTYLGLATEFCEALDYFQVDYVWRLYSGGHNEDYWRSHIQDYLLWYTSGW